MQSEETRLDMLNKAREYATAEANRVYLTELRKSTKAELMKRAEANGVTAANAQERDAYAHPDYINLLEKLRQATETATLYRLEFKMKEWEIEVWRTKHATRRAEMNIR